MKPIPAYAFNDEGEQAYDYDLGDDDCEYDDYDYGDDDETPVHTPASPKAYVVAIYEIDKVYGGPEEGGWYYDTGKLNRVCKVFKNEDKAYAYCSRMNHWLQVAARKLKYGLGSVCYQGGEYLAIVHDDTAPKAFPEYTPHYE